MSVHLIGCVKTADRWAEVTLPPRPGRDDPRHLGPQHRLALIAFADSANDHTRVAFPGTVGVQAWVGCSRSTANQLIADLVDAGYLHQHRRAAPGRRAEYVVFPHGCCSEHRDPAPDHGPEPTLDDVRRVLAAAGVRLDRDQEEALTNTPFVSDVSDTNGSDTSAPSGSNESEQSDTTTPPTPNVSDTSAPTPRRVQQRVRHVSDTSAPFNNYKQIPPLPPTPPAQGEQPASPPCCDGTRPCRRCGTTPRQLAAVAERRYRDEQRRAAQAAETAEAERRRAATADPATVAHHIAEARAALQASTT